MKPDNYATNFSVPHLLGSVLWLLTLLILIDVVTTYMIQFGARLSSHHPFVRLVRRIVNPMLEPVRRALPPYKTNNIDFSPMIVMMVLQLIAGFLWRM